MPKPPRDRANRPTPLPAHTAHREEEAKFRVTPGHLSRLTDPAAELTGYSFAPVGVVPNTDTYLDDAHYSLLRHGYALRLRDKGGEAEVGLKRLADTGAGVIQQRDEIAAAVPRESAGDPDRWPAPVVAMIAHLGADRTALRPLVVVRQQRAKSLVSPTGSSTPLAEWSLDRVAFVAPTDLDTVWQTLDELEVEHLGADTQPEFAKLIADVQQTYALKAVAASKFQRGMTARAAAQHGGRAEVTPDMDLAEAARLLLHQQFYVILAAEHGVRAGQNPDYVHNMRVAIRRSRAALRLFGHCFRKRVVRGLQRRLKQLAQLLGPVRDLDVAIANLRDFRRTLEPAERRAAKPLHRALVDQRAAAFARLVDYLDGEDHRATVVALDDFCSTPGLAIAKTKTGPEERPPRQVRHTVPSIILACFEQVRAYEVAFAGAELPPLAVYHALRIRAKYLRYSLEFMRGLLGTPGATIIDQLKELQDQLGLLNDAHVEQLRLAAWQRDMAENPALAHRAAEVETTIHRLSVEFPAHLARFVGPDNRSLLGAALAQL